MYPEFIAIYAGLAAVLVLLIVILILQIKILSSNAGHSRRSSKNTSRQAVVFCKNCASRYSASERVCPQCGTPR